MGETDTAGATDPSEVENWSGGFYGLSIKLGPSDDRRLEAALRALWEAAGLRRAFRRGPGGIGAEAVDVSAESVLSGALGTVAPIAGTGEALCSVTAMREVPRDPDGAPGADWLDLGLPLGSLGRLDRRVGAFPLDPDGDDAWQEPVDAWLEGVARAVFAACPYEHAVLGFEVTGVEVADAEDEQALLLAPGPTGELAFTSAPLFAYPPLRPVDAPDEPRASSRVAAVSWPLGGALSTVVLWTVWPETRDEPWWTMAGLTLVAAVVLAASAWWRRRRSRRV